MPNNIIKVNSLEVVVLLYNLFEAKDDRRIGFEDANRSFLDVVNTLNFQVHIEKSLVESALWSCNLLDEKDKFWHPLNHSFDEMVRKIAYNNKLKFDKKFNFFKFEEN